MDIALILAITSLSITTFLLALFAFYAFQLRGVDILANNALEETNALHRILRRLERRLEDVELLAVSTSKRLAQENESSEGGNDNVQ